jgi:hypothetical protein
MFLGLTRTCGLCQLEIMKQEGLIAQIIEAMGLDAGMINPKWTPDEAAPLVKDSEGAPATGAFSYRSIVSMLLYLSGHTHPDIVYAVNCVARYMFCPKKSHEEALKRIGRHLKAASTRGSYVRCFEDQCIS